MIVLQTTNSWRVQIRWYQTTYPPPCPETATYPPPLFQIWGWWVIGSGVYMNYDLDYAWIIHKLSRLYLRRAISRHSPLCRAFNTRKFSRLRRAISIHFPLYRRFEIKKIAPTLTHSPLHRDYKVILLLAAGEKISEFKNLYTRGNTSDLPAAGENF